MKILWIPHAGWHIPQRAHAFCRILSERHEVHATDWTADFVTWRDVASRRYARNFFYRRGRDGNVTVHGIPRVSPALYIPALRRFNTLIFARMVQSIIAQYRIDAVVGSFVVPPPKAPRLVLDVCDDNPAYWLEYGHNPAMAKEIAEAEAAWVSVSDHVVTVGSVLKDKLQRSAFSTARPPVTVIPNGIDLRRYRSADGRRVRKLLGLEKRRIVGLIAALGAFTGVLRYLEAIRCLADPAVAHLLVGSGPLLKEGQQFAKDHNLSNVTFTGQVDSGEVADYFAALDVGVIPFDLADFTHAACPIKLLEYTACGEPVVCTPLQEVRRMQFPNVILAGDSPAAISECIRQALRLTRAQPPQIEAYDVRKLAARWEEVLTDA